MMCVRCQDQPRSRKAARGLCVPCYHRVRTDRTLEDWPRRTVSRAEVMEEWAFLANPHAPIKHEARRLAPVMGMKPDTLARAVTRAGVRGDGKGWWVA